MNRLALIDRDDGLLTDPFIPHGALAYEFIQGTVDGANGRKPYEKLLLTHGIDIVIDLSLNETRPVLRATDENGVRYLNTGIINRPGESFYQTVVDFVEQRESPAWNAPHILCAGMNPGIVNMWVRKGMERFGAPLNVVHFEYDTGQPVEGWRPIVTWSRETFVNEAGSDPGGYMEGKGKIRYLYPNALKHRVSMKEVLTPIMPLDEYPRGLPLLHEENITIAQRYDVPSRFLFAMDPRTMDHIEAVYDKDRELPAGAMMLGDNRKTVLQGAVTIGVRLQYRERDVYFFNRTEHGACPGVSGSCVQVAAGVYSALLTMIGDSLQPRIHFVEDLFGTACQTLMDEHLPTEERIFPRDGMRPRPAFRWQPSAQQDPTESA